MSTTVAGIAYLLIAIAVSYGISAFVGRREKKLDNFLRNLVFGVFFAEIFGYLSYFVGGSGNQIHSLFAALIGATAIVGIVYTLTTRGNYQSAV